MKIGIRVTPLLSPMTGIPVYLLKQLQALSAIDKENEYFLYTSKKIEGDNPKASGTAFAQYTIKVTQ